MANLNIPPSSAVLRVLLSEGVGKPLTAEQAFLVAGIAYRIKPESVPAELHEKGQLRGDEFGVIPFVCTPTLAQAELWANAIREAWVANNLSVNDESFELQILPMNDLSVNPPLPNEVVETTFRDKRSNEFLDCLRGERMRKENAIYDRLKAFVDENKRTNPDFVGIREFSMKTGPEKSVAMPDQLVRPPAPSYAMLNQPTPASFFETTTPGNDDDDDNESVEEAAARLTLQQPQEWEEEEPPTEPL